MTERLVLHKEDTYTTGKARSAKLQHAWATFRQKHCCYFDYEQSVNHNHLPLLLAVNLATLGPCCIAHISMIPCLGT